MTGRETVVNKALSGEEMKILLRQDFERLLANEGLLSVHMAYGRVAWDIRLRLHMTNWMNPESESSIASRPFGKNVIEIDPSLAAVLAPPLQVESGESSIVSASELSHSVDSPNSERLLAGLPVPVTRRQHDGTMLEEKIAYPSPAPGESAPPNIQIVDQSLETRTEWQVAAPAEPVATPDPDPEKAA